MSETALRERPELYKTERRRTLSHRVHTLEAELDTVDPASFRADVAAYERELALRALEPLTLAESWEDVCYAARRLGRALLEAARS